MESCCASCRFHDKCSGWVFGAGAHADCVSGTCCWLKTGLKLLTVPAANSDTASGRPQLEDAACGTSDCDWSWGWPFVILVGGGAAVYFFFGTLLNVLTQRGASLPHAEFWRELGALVQDGARSSVGRAIPSGHSATEVQYVSVDEQAELDAYRNCAGAPGAGVRQQS